MSSKKSDHEDNLTEAAAVAGALAGVAAGAVAGAASAVFPAGVMTGILEFLSKRVPDYPPCDGAVVTAGLSGWRCYNGIGHLLILMSGHYVCDKGSSKHRHGPELLMRLDCKT